MFKIISIAIFAYIFYRLVKPKVLDEPQAHTPENKNQEGEFIDYEEIEDWTRFTKPAYYNTPYLNYMAEHFKTEV